MSRSIELLQSWPSLVACVAAFGFMGYGVQNMGSAKEDELRKVRAQLPARLVTMGLTLAGDAH